MNPTLFTALTLSVGLLFVAVRQRNLSSKLKKLRDDWGKIPEDSTDIESARIFFDLNQTKFIQRSYCVDEATWQDLDLDEIFALLNRTVTPVGAQCLFHLLRHPVLHEDVLLARETLIDRFSADSNLRERAQLALQRMAEKDAKYLPYSLWKPLPERPAYAKFLPLMSFISLAVLPLVLFEVMHVSTLILIFVINFIVRSFVKRKIDVFVSSFQYLGVLIGTAEEIASLKFDALENIQKVLRENLRATKTIAKKIFGLQFKDSLGLIEYVRIYFLWDVSGFYAAIGQIAQHIDELRSIFEIVGEVDGLIAVASFRRACAQYCHPELTAGGEAYVVKGIYDPLLSTPVPNSFGFESNNVLITGSNMAGKTTFLKTLGVNAILAQTIHMTMAEKYKAPFLTVLSSIGREDNLVQGKSYYLAEVESILRLLKASESDGVHLFILDEIFRGTNSVERLAASVAVLDDLANEKDFIVVATHDLQLTEALDRKYRNFHFREQVCDHGLSFDYQLHPGPATTRNAIALLGYVGYPKRIVENALQRLQKSGT